MKLLSRDVSAEILLKGLERRLRARGLAWSDAVEARRNEEGVEARIDPRSFSAWALEEYADPLQPPPARSHRSGLSRAAALWAKGLLRAASRPFLREALTRQRTFNGHVRDAYVQLSAEVMRLQEEVERLQAKKRTKKKP